MLIKIDREMLLDELYRLRSKIPMEDGDEAKHALMDIVQLVQNAPADVKQAQYPRTRRN